MRALKLFVPIGLLTIATLLSAGTTIVTPPPPPGAGSGDNVSVNGTAAADADLDDATPASPANSINVKWQKDALTPNNVSANVPYASPLTVTGGNLTVGIVGAASGGTGDDTSATTGVPRISAGNWLYDAGVSHLAASTSADLRGVLSDEVGTGAAMFGLISTMADDLSCTGSQVVRRNAGDTAFECATPAGGSNTGRWTYLAVQDASGFLCSNCPVAPTEYFPIVIANMSQTTNVRVVAFCDLACNASTVVAVINDADNSVIASVAGPNAADVGEAGACTAESLSGDINTKVRINGSGAAADDYRITHVMLEAC